MTFQESGVHLEPHGSSSILTDFVASLRGAASAGNLTPSLKRTTQLQLKITIAELRLSTEIGPIRIS